MFTNNLLGLESGGGEKIVWVPKRKNIFSCRIKGSLPELYQEFNVCLAYLQGKFQNVRYGHSNLCEFLKASRDITLSWTWNHWDMWFLSFQCHFVPIFFFFLTKLSYASVLTSSLCFCLFPGFYETFKCSGLYFLFWYAPGGLT